MARDYQPDLAHSLLADHQVFEQLKHLDELKCLPRSRIVLWIALRARGDLSPCVHVWARQSVHPLLSTLPKSRLIEK